MAGVATQFLKPTEGFKSTPRSNAGWWAAQVKRGGQGVSRCPTISRVCCGNTVVTKSRHNLQFAGGG